jgi:hypothetical protein
MKKLETQIRRKASKGIARYFAGNSILELKQTFLDIISDLTEEERIRKENTRQTMERLLSITRESKLNYRMGKCLALFPVPVEKVIHHEKPKHCKKPYVKKERKQKKQKPLKWKPVTHEMHAKMRQERIRERIDRSFHLYPVATK